MHSYNFEIVAEGYKPDTIRDSQKRAFLFEYAHRFFNLIQTFTKKPELYLPQIHPRENSFTLYISREFKPSELERIADLGLNAVIVQDEISDEAA